MNLIDQVYRELDRRGPLSVVQLYTTIDLADTSRISISEVRSVLSELEQLGDVVPDLRSTPTRWLTSELASHLQQMEKYGVDDPEPDLDDEPYLRDVPFWER